VLPPSDRRWFVSERWLAAALALAACAACKRKSPPILFHSDAPGPSRPDAAALVDAASDASAPAVVEGAPVDGDGSALTVDGATLRAAEGERFVRFAAVDLDGDGAAADLAVARTGVDGRARPPALYRRVGAAFEPVPLPHAEPTDPRCADATVRITSPRSAAFGWRCPPRPYDGQALAEEQCLVALSATPGVRERASVLAGALPDTELALRLEGRDLDGDGRDEVLVGLAAGRPGVSPRASARAVLFERAGAFARDTSEPAQSLDANLTAARQALSRGRAGVAEARETLDHLLRLRRAFCRANGMARVRFQGAQGFDCPAPSGAADLYTRVLINLGELPAAEAQLSADNATDFGPVTSERVLGDLERASITERGILARPGPFVGAALDDLCPARLRALSFEGRTIALRGPAGGTVDVATLTVTQGAAGALTDLLPRSPDGAEAVVGFAETCAGVAIVRCRTNDPACASAPLRAEATGLPPGAQRTVLPALPSLTLSSRCGATPDVVRGMSARQAHVLSWGPEALVVAVHRSLYRVTPAGEVTPVLLGEPIGAQNPPGGALSPNGSMAVLAGLGGLWVRERNAWRRWSPEALTGRFAQLTDVTVSADGRSVAGLVGTQLWLLDRPQRARR